MKIVKTENYQPATIKYGYTDQVLKVDLSHNTLSPMDLPPDFKKKFIGGRGYALKLIWDETKATTRYDSPENMLVMASGPLCNEPRFPGSGKFIVGAISPLTDTFVDSNIGGHFAPLLKVCGFDALAITGKSETDVVLIIDADAGNIRIVKAPSFDEKRDKGGHSYGTALLEAFNDGILDDSMAMVTTTLGAKNTKFGIINSLFYDKRRKRLRAKQAGRGGTGTVMAVKGLKAVIVRCSNSKVSANNPFDEKGVKTSGGELKKVVSKVDPQSLRLTSWGTTVLVEYMDKYHILPVKNYQYGQHPEAQNTFADVFLERYFSKTIPDGCYKGCNLACAKGAEDVKLKFGPHAGKKVGIDGPEYETIGAVTCMGIFDPQFVMDFNYYCDEYGLDTISMGVTTSFLMECVQRGYLAETDIGYKLSWGSIAGADRLLHETANGIGFGKICGQGVHRAKFWIAEKYADQNNMSAEKVLDEINKFAMETKGLEFSMYITKESLAQQGGYGFALKGPQHDEAWLIFIDQVHKELPTFELKADALRWFPLIRTWFNTVGLCKLPWIDVRHPDAASTDNPAKNLPTLDYYVQYYNATVNDKKSLQDILNDSERLSLLQKLINLRHGKGTRKSDIIPERAMGPAFFNEYQSRQEYYDNWLKEQLENGSGNGKFPAEPENRHALIMKLRKQAYEQLCDTVYKAKGFTPNAVPTHELLEKFGLMDKQAAAVLRQYR